MPYYFFELKLKWLPFFLNDNYYSFLFEDDFKAMIPECFLLFSVCTLLLYGVSFTSIKQNKIPILATHTSWIAILCIFFTCILLKNNPIVEAALFYHTFKLDNLSLFFKMLVLVGSLVSIVMSLQYIEQENLNPFELQTIIVIASVSMLFLISSADFISIYLAIELQSLCFYVMAGVQRISEFSSEAGLKYFLLGAFSSGILAFGLALQYGFTGTTNLEELSKIFVAFLSTDSFESSSGEIAFGIASLRGCELGMIFILVGFLFKLTAVPFHMWAPDVYEGAPTSVTAFFAIVPKVAILAVLVRLCYGGFYDFMFPWQKMLILSCIASMILGSIAALSQNKIKRLLAWSSINHVGYFLIAVCCGTSQSLQALAFYLVIYLIMTISLFQFVLCSMRRDKINAFVFDSQKSWSVMPSLLNATTQNEKGSIVTHGRRLKYTTDFAHLAKTNTVLAITLTITMFSIAGIPPLAGFYSKAFLLFAAMSASQSLLALVAIITSVISCFYYIRIVKIMYFEAETVKPPLTFTEISKESSFIFAITLAALAFFCFFPTPLFAVTHKMALSFTF